MGASAPWWMSLPYNLNPANWSVGGQKVFGANSNNPNAGNTPRAVAGGMAPGLGKSTSEQTDKDAADARQKKIDDFFDELNKPLDMNDPYVKNILMNARQTTLTSANNAGIFGPYSQNLAEQSFIKGSADLQDAKQGRALQALGMGTSQFNNQRDFNYDVAKDKYTNEMDLWKYNQGKNQGLGGLIGGGIGALGGGLLGGPGGATAGWQVGSGVGGMFGGGNSPPPTFKPGGGY